MNRLATVLARAAADFEDLEMSWAVVGGLAVSARTEPRFTRDVDLVVSVTDDDQAEAVIRRLGYPVRASVEQERTGRLATVRLQPTSSSVDVVLDLLFASSGIEPEVAADAERLELMEGLRVPVARSGYLIALKLLAEAPDRPQDLADLRNLLAVAEGADLAIARTAIGLVAARGFARGKDLGARLDQLLESPPSDSNR